MDPRQELEQLRKMKRLQELEAKAQGVQSPPNRPGQAALEGFGETATLGYLPQLQAAAEPAMNAVLNKITGQNVETDPYVQRRDENIARQHNLAEQNPKATLAGKVAGIGASMLAPMGAIAGTGSKAMQGIRTGATMGAAYNPGDEKGEVSPLQLGKRSVNAGIGGVLGGTLGAIGDKLSTAARRSRTVGELKDSAELAPQVKSEIDEALQGLNQNKIKPAADKLKELLKGKQLEVDPTYLRGVSPRLDKYAQLLEERAGNSGEDFATIAADKANILKRNLDRQAKYAASTPFEPGAAAKEKTAKAAADVIRNKISQVDPGVAPLNEEMGQAIRIRNSIARQAKSRPLRAINGKPGTDQGSMIDYIDKYAGSKLEQRAQDIDIAKSRLFPQGVAAELVHPLQATKALYKMGVRGAGATANLIEPVSNKATNPKAIDSLTKILMELKR
jgi:hypothetical protein